MMKLVVFKSKVSYHNNFVSCAYEYVFDTITPREGLVFEAFLDTDIHHNFWILQSVALLNEPRIDNIPK